MKHVHLLYTSTCTIFLSHTAAQNEVTRSQDKVRGLYFLAVIFAVTIGCLNFQGASANASKVTIGSDFELTINPQKQELKLGTPSTLVSSHLISLISYLNADFQQTILVLWQNV